MPQVFHDKEDKPKSFMVYPSNLFSAINNQLGGNEAKVLLTLLGCKGDGSFSPSTAYMQKMTGISQPNNYYKVRKQLEDKGYIQLDEKGNIYVDVQKILAKANDSLSQNAKQDKDQSSEASDP